MADWRVIPNTDGAYWVSSEGYVVSFRRGPRRQLKSPVNSDGYPHLNVYSDTGDMVSCKVHQLVARAFVPRLDDTSEINHIDGDKTNNMAANLEWISHRANTHHAVQLGLRPKGVRGLPAGVKKVKGGSFVVRAFVNGRNLHFGQFKSLSEAMRVNGDLQDRLVNNEDVSDLEASLKRRKTSVYKGVSRHKDTGKWQAYVDTDRGRRHLGLFVNENDAKHAVSEAEYE